MAESLVSFVLDQVATIASHEVQLVTGVDAEIRKLTSNLRAIQAVLADAEKRQVEDATVKLWLEKLKDVSYDIDDVLDEWKTAILKQDAEKVCLSGTFSSGFCFHHVCLRDNIAVKIKELNERLATISDEKNAYNFQSGKGSQDQEPGFLTTSIIDASEVFGREQDANNIKNMFLSGNSEATTPRVVSIVGMGGLGKTTLARLAFNDAAVEGHFDKKIWVCVSNPFDDKRIAKEILESLTGMKTDLDAMETILRKIGERVSGKKILLVLDDVWTEDSTRWEELKNSLICCSPQSRILLTTRKEKVATVMGSKRADIVPVESLSEEWCWKLFTRLAFAERPIEECNNLEDVGRQIVEKCKGLPLAVKTIGSLLRFKKTKEQWQSVLESDMWEIEEIEEKVFHPLLVSYYDLPSVLRQCFSFCAIFPEDFVIDKDDLIKFWMAQGFLNETHHKAMEVVGEEYFNELAMRSFFQDFVKNENGDIVSCKLHDLVLSFARFLTKNEGFLVTGSNNSEKIMKASCSLPSKTIRHSFLQIGGGEDANFPVQMHNWKKARTLMCRSEGPKPWNLTKSMDKLTCLRSLRLEGLDDAMLTKKIGKLIHLRFLDLSWNAITTLPKGVCDLYNLQTLDITNCTELSRLPSGIGKLRNLRHLENWSAESLDFIPKEMRSLTNLRTLREFVVSTEKSALKIEDLGNLGKLQQSCLAIRGLQRARATDVRDGLSPLLTKIGVRNLTINFSVRGGKRGAQNEAVVLEALELPLLLESLVIRESAGPTLFPSWMTSLTMLKTLVLFRCENWKSLPPLGKLLFLENLEIHALFKTKKVGGEFLGIKEREGEGQTSSIIAFPNLKRLLFSGLTELEDWEGGSGRITIMPLLHSLSICNCPNLKALPHHIFHQLQGLTIYGCPILSRRFEEQRGEDWSYISHIPKRVIEKPTERILKLQEYEAERRQKCCNWL